MKKSAPTFWTFFSSGCNSFGLGELSRRPVVYVGVCSGSLASWTFPAPAAAPMSQSGRFCHCSPCYSTTERPLPCAPIRQITAPGLRPMFANQFSQANEPTPLALLFDTFAAIGIDRGPSKTSTCQHSSQTYPAITKHPAFPLPPSLVSSASHQ